MARVEFLPGEPFAIAITALGGQGGGVLASWLVELAEHAGWTAQSTSVPGVAQRTGATVYYIELFPPLRGEPVPGGRRPGPVLALMPAPGRVDLVIAAELMEAGRALDRGLVSPDRTTLVASSHRSYAVSEKTVPGNGIADAAAVTAACAAQARRFVCADMQVIAERTGSVISASLFGAVAASDALPFGREAFEQTIRRAGVGVEASLRAFGAGLEAALEALEGPGQERMERQAEGRGGGQGEGRETREESGRERLLADLAAAARAAHPRVAPLLERLRTQFPAPALPMLRAGLGRVLEFQDEAYGAEYLDRVHALCVLDRAAGGGARQWVLTVEAAGRVARAMAYDDLIRVADLKTRASRFDRIRDEMGTGSDRLLATTEYFHPRLEELCGSLPARLGLWIENAPRLSRWLAARLDRGRRIRSSTLPGFLVLYALAGMRRLRRGT
ncbi:MAG: indolepyruvate oxidoreductase subunit beta family protein, partial [Burkholderiales bacterium]